MTQRPCILIVDDEASIREPLVEYLARNELLPVVAASAAEARVQLTLHPVDLIILDIMMPGEDGLSLCRDLRSKSDVPIILLTARTDDIDRIIGLEMGADDYLPKTFSTRELLARLRAVTRRTVRSQNPESGSDEEYVVGPLRVRPASRTAILGDVPLTLTPVEYDLLVSLAKARGRVKTREALLDEIRERDYDVFDRSIDVHISALRKKLNDDPKHPRFIRTLRSAGYMMVDPEDPE